MNQSSTAPELYMVARSHFAWVFQVQPGSNYLFTSFVVLLDVPLLKRLLAASFSDPDDDEAAALINLDETSLEDESITAAGQQFLGKLGLQGICKDGTCGDYVPNVED